MIFSNQFCLCSLTTLAGKCGTNWSETCGVQIFNPLMCFIPWKQTIYILEPRTLENKTTGLDHCWGVIDSNRGEGGKKKRKWLTCGPWGLRREFGDFKESAPGHCEQVAFKLASFPFIKDLEDLNESVLQIRPCPKCFTWIFSLNFMTFLWSRNYFYL